MSRPVGIFGGTFDPVHFGHLRAALELMEGLGLEQVRLVPASVPPHRDEPGAGPDQRLAMVRAAAASQAGFVVDERELRRSGPSYMVDTLQSLREEFGQRPLCLLLGLDAYLGLPKWHRWERIIELAHIVVAHRPGWRLDGVREGREAALHLLDERCGEAGSLAEAPAGRVVLHPVTQLDISATDIRRRVREGRSARFLLPDAVWDIILKEQLYR